MSENRRERVTAVWSWLPAFRIVAEAQQLALAAEMLEVTPAALSLAVAKLERKLGVRLFDRTSRGMLPTPAGNRLADQVRNAMRDLDDAMTELSPSDAEGDWVRIAFESHALGAFIHHALPALLALSHRLNFRPASAAKVSAALLAGDIDLALTLEPSTDDRVVCKVIGELKCHWATLNPEISLPPSGEGVRLQTPPAVGMPSSVLLQQQALCLPMFVPLPSRCHTLAMEPKQVWRVTRTRPSKTLIALSSRLMECSK